MKKQIILIFIFLAASLYAQEGFGFGDYESSEEESAGNFGFGDFTNTRTGASSSPVKIGGSVSAGITSYVLEDAAKTSLGDIFSGSLHFSVAGSNADAVINLNLAPVLDGSSSPVTLDEAYIRAYFGSLDITAGLRKMTWGKADSMGPLDVINPLDYSDLSKMDDLLGMKIARPLIHASYNIGSFTKVEAVFVPWFTGYLFDMEKRWKPTAQFTRLIKGVGTYLENPVSVPNPAYMAAVPESIREKQIELLNRIRNGELQLR